MTRRVVFAILMLSIVFLGFFIPGFAWTLVMATSVIAIFCIFELAKMLKVHQLRVYRRVAAFGVVALILEAAMTQMQYTPHVFGLAICFAWVVRMKGEVRGAWGDVSATCFTLAYIGIPFAAIIKIFLAGPDARAWLLMTLAIIWASDSCALFVGKAVGKTKLWPKISPGKTWEGTWGGIIGAFLVIYVARVWFPQYFDMVSDFELLCFGFGFAVIGQLGDLAESLLKRDIGVKDSGSPLTGHGGFLDLMDAVVFAAIPLLAYLDFFQPNVLM